MVINKKKGILLIAMFLIISLPLASATMLDYDDQTRTATLSSNFLFINTGEIATVQLLTPLNNKVGLGYQEVARMKVNGFKDYKDFISQIEFYDINNNMGKFNKEYDLKVFEGYELELIEDLGIDTNGEVIKLGEHYEEKEIWTKLTPADLKKNDHLIISIFTIVKQNDRVEWIPTIAEKEIIQWASYTAVGDVYYKSKDPSASFPDTGNLEFTDGILPPALISNSGWFGFNSGAEGVGETINISIDLSRTGNNITNITLRSLTNSPVGLYLPITTAWGSNDNSTYNIIGSLVWDGANASSDTVRLATLTTSGNDYRYVRYKMVGTGQWIFVGEGAINFSDQNLAPNVTAISPANNTIYTTAPIDVNFTCYGSDDTNFTEMEFYLNESLTQTNSSGLNNTNYIFTETLNDGNYNWSCIGNDNESEQTQSEIRYLEINTTPFIEFLTPPTLPNYANTTKEYIPMKVNVSTSNYKNNTFDLYNINGTSYHQIYTNQTYDINFTDIPDAHYHYNATICTTTDKCNSTETRHINHDVTPPQINSTSPSGIYAFLEDNETLDLNYSIEDNIIGVDSCWFIYNETTTYLNCSENSTTFNYSIGKNNLTIYANDTLSNENSLLVNWSVVVDQYTKGANYQIVGEGTDVTFNLTIDYSISHTQTAKLHINGDSYDPDNIVTIAGQNFYEATINMPDGYGNATGNFLDWYWIYNVTDYNDYINTTAQNLTIYSVEIDDCALYNELILNLILNDEETRLNLPGVNESSQVEIDLTISGVDNSSIMWQYSNTYLNETNPQVCIPLNILNYSSYTIDFTMGFDNTDHVQEFYYLDNGTLDNTKVFNSYTTYNIDLYDLLTIDSTTFLFNFFNKDGLAVDNAIVHTFRRYIGDGEFLEVERSNQDNNGETHMHLVEEDVIYYFMITQGGVIIFISEQYNALCETLPCTITLTETGEFEEIPTDYSLINGSSLIIDNQTERTSTYIYSMTAPAEVEFILYQQEFNGSTTEIDSASSTSSAGTLEVDIPLHAGNISYFTAVYKEGEFVQSQWVDLNDMDASNFFGDFLAVFLGFLIILTLVLIGVTEKSGTIVIFIFGLFFTGALGLTKLTTSTGQNLLIYVVIAGGIIIFKLAKKRS